MADPDPAPQQTDDNAFLVGIVPEDQIAQISKATGVPADVVADAMAFEQKWTAAGLPATEQAMGARTMAAQAVMALVLGMNVELKLVLDYVTDAIEATKAIDAKYAGKVQTEPGQPQDPAGDDEPGDDDDLDDEDDDEGGDEDDDEPGDDETEPDAP